MTKRASAMLALAVLLGGCAGAFLPRSEPIDLGLDKTRVFSISVEGPEDMPEWGELLWAELASTLSALSGVKVAEPAPGVLLVKAKVESWDYEERQELRSDPFMATGQNRRPPYCSGSGMCYQRCTALMGVTVDVTDPATGKLLAQRKYLGVEHDTQPFERIRAPRPLMRRAAGKVAQQFADDLEAGRR